MILSVAIVSLLFGSLLYNQLALAGKPQPQTIKDTVEIDVFGWATRQHSQDPGYAKEWGIYVEDAYPAEMLFAFSPTNNPSNITKILVTVFATDGIDHFTVNVNGVDTDAGRVQFHDQKICTSVITLDPTVVQINKGINSIRLSGKQGWLSVYRLSVFIEYEYQA